MYVAAAEVEHEADGYTFRGQPVTRRSGKMGKSLKNSVSPDDIYDTYGADTLRLYEMATGPLDADRPWHTGDIIGVHRFLQRLWRAIIDEASGEVAGQRRPARRRDRAPAAPDDHRRPRPTSRRCATTRPSPG